MSCISRSVMKKRHALQKVFYFYKFLFFILNLTTFCRTVRKRKQRRKSMISSSGDNLGGHFFSLQSLKCLLKCRQKHSQEEPIIEFRLCFRFLMRHIVEKVMQTFGQLGGNVFKTFVCSKWRSLFCPPGTRK